MNYFHEFNNSITNILKSLFLFYLEMTRRLRNCSAKKYDVVEFIMIVCHGNPVLFCIYIFLELGTFGEILKMLTPSLTLPTTFVTSLDHLCILQFRWRFMAFSQYSLLEYILFIADTRAIYNIDNLMKNLKS